MLMGLDLNSRRETVWTAWEYSPLDDSEEILGKLLESYWGGLVKPLRFFPDSSWDYAHALLEKNKAREDALQRARNKWAGSAFSRGECEDAYYELCFGNSDPLDSAFQRIAEEVFTPLLAHQREVNNHP